MPQALIALPPVPKLRVFEDHEDKVEFYKSTLVDIFVARGYEASSIQIDTYLDYQEWMEFEPEPEMGINIIDINLGLGKETEGIEVLKQAQEKTPGSKNIVITAYTHHKGKVEDLGGIYLTKTGNTKTFRVQIEVIEHHIYDFLEKKRPTDPESYPHQESSTSDQEVLTNPRNLEGVKFSDAPKDDPQPDTLLDLRFLIKRAIWHATEEQEDDIYGIESEYELSHQEGKLTLTRAVEEEISDFMPQKLSLNQSSDGYISKLSLMFPAERAVQTFSFPQDEALEKWTPLDTKASSALRLLYEQVKAYNLAWKHVFETRDGESQINQIRTAIVTLGDPGKKAFMQAIYAHVMHKMLAHSISTSLKDVEEEVASLSAPFYANGIPQLISIEYGEIEEIDEEQDEATVLLKTWIHPLKESRRTVFSLSRLRDIGRKAEEGTFLYTTFMREIREYGAELEYADPELAKLSFA